MKKSLFLTVLMLPGAAGSARAANFAVITSPPTILSLITLVLAGAAVAICLRIMAAVKGGFLSRSWQWLCIGFGLLAVGQLLALLQTFEILSLPDWLAPALAVTWAGILFYGVFETKRILE